MVGLMEALAKLYEKPSASNQVSLMRKLFNLKMVEDGNVNEHLNQFNTLTGQLESIGINSDDEARALLVLSSLPDSWEGLVIAVSNSLGTEKLKHENVVSTILSEESRRKCSGVVFTFAMNVEDRGRNSNRGNKGRGRSQSRKGKLKTPYRKGDGCWNCGKKGQAVSNSSGTEKLKHENVVSTILSEESRRKCSGVVFTYAMNVENRERETGIEATKAEVDHSQGKANRKLHTGRVMVAGTAERKGT
ncbi:hypothetical protein AAC387_Pa01g0207 [Persea americana]|eukprot:TRINITY_DN24590_c2_g1_i1.p1 TRINITY_DN24590_c2_g1~~TRINITY_DN24590_c2_g1_i1.p1  ORF type:complete len:247 (+),score=32.41 TRINITY_DN24590_c2_g1_i1:396-1136(+)